MLVPRMWAFPLLALTNPAAMEKRVVLPAPFGPIMPKTEFFGISNDMLSRTVLFPYFLVMFWNDTAISFCSEPLVSCRFGGLGSVVLFIC